MINELSIIVPTLNEEVYLPCLLDSIAKQTYAGKVQVIVVDGHSDDRTVEVARSFAAQVPDLLVVQAARNAGHQRNVGAKHAKYSYLLFLDADVVLPPDILERLTAKVHMRGPFIVGTMHTMSRMTMLDRLCIGIAYVLLFASWAARIPAINGDFILTTRENHNKIGGFAEGALLGEDIDYGLRSVRAGAVYRYFLKPEVIASERRARVMGRWRLVALWCRGYIHVLRHGPIFPGQGFEYPFGHYGSAKTKTKTK